jgi:four helix bundle protein
MNNVRKNVLKEKTVAFAVKIVKIYQYLCKEKCEDVMSKQLLRSGTAIGVSVCEAEYTQSIPDFISKLSISLKEANETAYWLLLLKKTEYISEDIYIPITNDCYELLRLLTSIINISKKKI